MKSIKIIDKVKPSAKDLQVAGSKQLAHLQQGAMDGACAVYSMMMCLIIERIIKRNLVTDPPLSLKRNTSEGRLVRFFLEQSGMVINGYELDDLYADLNNAFKKSVDAHYSEIEKNEDIQEVIEWLDKNHPVEIGFTRKRKESGHALVAIGYQIEETKTILYCLDPGYPMGECQMWNNVLEIDNTATAQYNCYNMREDSNVVIDEMMVCVKR